MASSILAGVIYHLWAYGEPGIVTNYAAVGMIAGLAVVMPRIFRDEVGLEGSMAEATGNWRIFRAWNYAIVSVIVVAALTKTTAMYSRGAMVLFYVIGLAAMIGVRAAARPLLRYALSRGLIAPRRVMLVGTAEEMRDFAESSTADWPGMRVVHKAHLPISAEGGEVFLTTLRRYAGKARKLQVDDVIVLTPWSQQTRVNACIEAFSLLPVAIHLAAGKLLDRFSHAELRRFGSVSAMSLIVPPMPPLSAMIKRAGDIIAAVGGLIMLSPLFAVVAIMIKRDSAGPVFFKQRRLGFNQREFQIYKFRSMTTMDDGDKIVQARVGDARITKVGAFLRKSNIDELPQLINVLRGEMSIVGPRPHAVAHDKDFEQRIMKYPRRLNVKPGITGWAQVNGLRGETDTDEKMAKRVEADLYYIDHWSIWLDAKIVFLTLLSRKAFSNAR